MWVLTSPAVRSPAPTRSRSRSLRASLARSPGSTEASSFNQPLDSWDTSKVTTMQGMWVLTSPAVRSPAPTRSRSRSRSLRASLARSPGSTEATAFNQDLTAWVVNNVNGPDTCSAFCLDGGFNPKSRIPSFPSTCGDPGC
jgi:surface protein